MIPQSTISLCSCGSGLRAVRCCSADIATRAPDEATRHLTPLIERALAAHRQGEREVAERLCLDVLELAPDRTGALSVLYEIRQAQGNQPAALALLRRLVALDPNNLGATTELALVMLGRGNLAEAEVHARNSVRLSPESPQAHNLMGMIMTEANRLQVGEFHYRRVLELTAKSGMRDPVTLANLAWNLKRQGRMAESRTLYREAIAAGPPVRQTLLGLARLEEADRAFDAAMSVLDDAAAAFPDDHSVELTRALVLGRQRRYDEALQLIDSTVGADRRLGPNEMLERGRLLDQLGRYDDAWTAFADGKQLARELSGIGYLDAAAQQMFARLRSFFTADRLRLLPKASSPSGADAQRPQPVFILGFPRSGTTLVEQTLSAHPRIAAGDELPMINELAHIMPRMLASPLGYPEALAELWMGDQRDGLDHLRDYYLRKAEQSGVLRPGASRFTDKMPLNETHLGLIALLFPEAPLLHVLRHPLDVMVSSFSNALTHGYFCASDLVSAATHYVRVMELVQHYRAEMTLRYLPIRYEDIVAEQETSVRTMLDFIGEEFEPACLTFHNNLRYARTASYAQVAEPLYDRSVGRWRNYRRQLEPVMAILEPVIARLGYTLG